MSISIFYGKFFFLLVTKFPKKKLKNWKMERFKILRLENGEVQEINPSSTKHNRINKQKISKFHIQSCQVHKVTLKVYDFSYNLFSP